MRPVSNYKSQARKPALLRASLTKSMCTCAYAYGGVGHPPGMMLAASQCNHRG